MSVEGNRCEKSNNRASKALSEGLRNNLNRLPVQDGKGQRREEEIWALTGGETQGKACTRASWGLSSVYSPERLIHLPVASARPPEVMSSTPPPPAGLLRNTRATREGTFLFSRTQERQGFSAPSSLSAHFRQFTHTSQRWCRSHRTS